MKKPLHERIAVAKERKAQLEARLAALQSKAKAVDRKRTTKRKIVVGAAVLIEMERSPHFAAYVRDMLAMAVTRPQDQEAIADLLRPAIDTSAPASNSNVDLEAAAPDPVRPADIPAAAFQIVAREKLTG